MDHSLRTSAGLLLLALLAATPSAAQDWKGRGRLHGVVLDPERQAIAGARVTLRRDGEGPDPFLTDAKGRWAYTGLAGGAWTIQIEQDGYRASEGTASVAEYSSAGPRIEIVLQPNEGKKASSEQTLSSLERGNHLLRAGRFAEARAIFEASLSDIEEGSRPLVELAIAGSYLGEGATTEARRRYLDLLADLSPDQRPAVWRQIAHSHHLEGDVDQAVAALEESLALAPDDTDTLRLIVDILLSAGRETEAAPFLARLPPETVLDAETLLNLGIAAFNAGDMEQAERHFDEAATSYPDLADAYYYRGQARLARGDQAGARDDLRRLLDLDPEHPRAAEARQLLLYLEP